MAGDERLCEGVALQAPIAVGLRELHEQCTASRSRLVLELLAVHERVRRRLDSKRSDVRPANGGHDPAKRPDAFSYNSKSRIRFNWHRDQAHERQHTGLSPYSDRYI